MAALTRDLFTLSPGEVDDMWIMQGSGEVSDSTDEHSDLQGSDEDSSDEHAEGYVCTSALLKTVLLYHIISPQQAKSVNQDLWPCCSVPNLYPLPNHLLSVHNSYLIRL